MNQTTLIKRNLAHYWLTNLAVILGVATAVAVLAGALLVGDSVRASLGDLVLSRLGRTDFVIAAPGFFRESLAGDLQSHDQFAANFAGICPLIALEGVVTSDENKARAGAVQVFGIDDRFWKFHGVNVPPPDGNDVLLSPALAQELSAKSGDTVILRIEKPSAIPAESMHGRKDDLGRTVRFTMREVLPASSLGEFSLRPQQGAVRALFVPLRKLQRNLEQIDKANVILLAAQHGVGWQQGAQSAKQILKDKFALADLALKLRILEEQKTIVLENESAYISDAVAGAIDKMPNTLNLKRGDVLTYLANTIRLGNREIPYSLVAAIDWQDLPLPPNTEISGGDRVIRLPDGGEDHGRMSLISSIKGKQVVINSPVNAYPGFIVLNQWAAEDLGAKINDDVELEYYLWEQEGRLVTKKSKFRVAGITPIQGVAVDRNFAPDYPGITNTDSLADWDPPFPIDLQRVRTKDEDYWRQYRTTPKAFIPVYAGQRLWSSRYGKLTSMRFTPQDSSDLQSVRDSFEKQLRAALDPVEMGIGIQSVKDQSLQASRGATDFGEYFAYFSFFLVVSALMLMTLFFKLGVEQRLREIGLLRAVGYSIKQIRSIFLREGCVLAVVGSLMGVLGAIAYGALMMWGLRTWWVGAVGTNLLRLHLMPQSLLIGGVAGIIKALACIWWTLRRLTPSSPRNLLTGSTNDQQWTADGSPSRRRFRAFLSAARLSVLFAVLGLAMLLVAALKLIGQVGGFFGAGTLLLIAIICFWSIWLRGDKRQTIQGHGLWPMMRLGFRNASSHPSRSVLCIALIASAAFIIVSVDAFRHDSKVAAFDQKSGNGGYPLMAESLLPIVHDLNGEQGREELNLNDEMLRDVRITRFRLRPGDDASCLNLYQPRNPRIIAPTDDFIRGGRFAFQSFLASLAKDEKEKANPWLLLNRELVEMVENNLPAVVPVIADANSLTYVLHLKIGDELTINASNGAPVKLRVVAALADSIFQGELLMSEKNFLKLFPDQEGFRKFLIATSPEKASAVAATLEDKLSDYGFDAIGTEEKLAGFHQVENTYLSTFQTLGGLGLLLGTLGLAAVLLRNVLERRRELALMRAVGYQSSHLSLTVIAENALMLGCGLLTGVLCALLAIIPALIARGGGVSAMSLALLLLAVSLTGLAASLMAVMAIIRSPLLPALRTE